MKRIYYVRTPGVPTRSKVHRVAMAISRSGFTKSWCFLTNYAGEEGEVACLSSNGFKASASIGEIQIIVEECEGFDVYVPQSITEEVHIVKMQPT